MLAFYARNLITHIVFFALLGGGWWMGRLSSWTVAILLILWVVGMLASASWPGGSYFFLAAVAIVDVILILRVVGHDIRIS